MSVIYVDADACPVKEQIIRVAERHGLTVYMVSNTWLRMAEGTRVKRIVVGNNADAADDWIAKNIILGDIVVTSDIRLAARCLERGARALDPSGKLFTEDNIGTQIAMRDLLAHLRDTGDIRGGGRTRNRRDRVRFLETLEKTIRSNFSGMSS